MPLATECVVEFGSQERRLVLRIEQLAPPPKGRKFLPTSRPHCLDEGVIRMADEIGEWGGLSILLTHEQQRDEWGEKDGAGSQFESLEAYELAQALAEHSVSNLIVVLCADDEFPSGEVPG